MELKRGELFANGRYSILKLAGEGGTASTYQAFDPTINSPVALKIYDPGKLGETVSTEIWNREHQALSRLNHPGIVRLLDAGRDGDSRFVVTEWVSGSAIDEEFDKRKSATWDEFYNLFGKQILDALCSAYESNIYHRDLSPKNILVQEDGVLKVIDFGQAKIGNINVGLTVADFRTAPYCPPEQETSRYSSTRDGYSFCAIAIRALCGYELTDHDDLYSAFSAIEIPLEIRPSLEAGLSRIPEERPSNIFEMTALFEKPLSSPVNHGSLSISVRCAPTVLEQLGGRDGESATGFEYLISDLNETVSLFRPADTETGMNSRVAFESKSYRGIFDIAESTQDHLVIISAQPRYFKYDTLIADERWIPNISFGAKLPRTEQEKLAARRGLAEFFRGFEEHLNSNRAVLLKDGEKLFDVWGKTLDAIGFLARTGIAPIRYSDLEINGNRITVSAANPSNATEGEIRVIEDHGRPVFNGEIENVGKTEITLFSKWPNMHRDGLPLTGELKIDWSQTRIALDRQRAALGRFSEREIANRRLADIVTMQNIDNVDIRTDLRFPVFDQSLSQEKRDIVNKFHGVNDLMLIHGPPGTGKTRLIVELIRQEISKYADSKILLVSQTHVAIDNALEPLLAAGLEIPIVRIGSGDRKISAEVAECSVEERGKALRVAVAEKTRHYVNQEAKFRNVTLSEITFGSRASRLLEARREFREQELKVSEMRNELTELSAKREKLRSNGTTSDDETQWLGRARTIDEELPLEESRLNTLRDRLGLAVQDLIDAHEDGATVANWSDEDLSNWANSLIDSTEKRDIRTLLELSEDWNLQFAESDDFTVAIISSASIVAGTCVGFCREKAALSIQYDLCVIDEASKAMTTELLLPMSISRKCVLVGDHHQLPAVVDHKLASKEILEQYSLQEADIRVQLFERLQSDLPAIFKDELVTQHRMRAPIGQLVSTCFYDGKLITSEEVGKRKVPDLSFAGLREAVTWIDTDPLNKWSAHQSSIGTSLINVAESNCILALLRKLQFVFSRAGEARADYKIGIVSGYAEQVKHIDWQLRREPGLDSLNIECDTVHAFQGRQVDICIYSVTRNNKNGEMGFLYDWRHLNVALSRARDYLVVVGGKHFCEIASEPNPFYEIVRHISNHDNCELTSWTDD